MQRNIKKFVHICIIIIILVAIVFTALMIILNYDENGETNMPFDIKRINIISTVDGQDVENSSNKWDIQVNQNNDIYIYIEKNENYKKTETIKTVKIDNIVVKQNPVKGEISIYKPTQNEKVFFENKDEYKIESLIYEGNKTSDIKNLKMANQGDKIYFRCSNNNIGTYISNDAKEIQFAELLKRINVSNEELKLLISFDLTIELNSKKSFKATYNLSFPVGNIVEEGKTSTEITDFKDVVFKRAQN